MMRASIGATRVPVNLALAMPTATGLSASLELAKNYLGCSLPMLSLPGKR